MDVLVIDDDEVMGGVLMRLLGRSGYTVTTASHGQVALTHLQRTRELPCVIVCDVIMPVMNGLEFRRQQLRDATLAPIPVIMMSGHQHFKFRAQQLGIGTFFLKPFDFKEMVQAVAHHCAHERVPAKRQASSG